MYDNGKYKNELTIGKLYILIKYKVKESYEYYKIIDDNNNVNIYPKKWFKSLMEIRNERNAKINKILG
jgi:hypothetical protein